jgi:hypothetical protein
MWAAVTQSTGKSLSSRLNTGFQYSPVRSIATWVTPWASSQSDHVSRSTVIVPNVRVAWCPLGFGPGTRTAATTVL